MTRKAPSPMRRVVVSLKVVALATVLATVVFAAERHLAVKMSPDEAVAAAVAPAYRGASVPPANSEGSEFYYFPSQFPEPTGETAALPPTF